MSPLRYRLLSGQGGAQGYSYEMEQDEMLEEILRRLKALEERQKKFQVALIASILVGSLITAGAIAGGGVDFLIAFVVMAGLWGIVSVVGRGLALRRNLKSEQQMQELLAEARREVPSGSSS